MPRKNTQDADSQGGSRRVTLRDIAKKAGVSHTAVSLALRDSPQVSPQTRERIQRIAQEMRYEPDPMLSALSNYRLSNHKSPVKAELAWITPLQDPDALRKMQEFKLYWDGANDAARRLGYNLAEFCTAEIPLQRMEEIFKARNIRGIILAKTLAESFQDETIDWHSFSWQDFSIIRLGRRADYPQAHFVTSAHLPSSTMAFSKITKKGYRRVGYIGEYTEARVFCAGFLYAQLAVPEEHRLPPLMSLDETPYHEKNKPLLNQWIEQNRPDAILTERWDIPQMLQDLGYRVPEDIGLATTSIYDTPIDAGIDQNSEEIGRTAVRMLAANINHNDFGIPSIRNETLIEGKWVDGSMLPQKDNEA